MRAEHSDLASKLKASNEIESKNGQKSHSTHPKE